MHESSVRHINTKVLSRKNFDKEEIVIKPEGFKAQSKGDSTQPVITSRLQNCSTGSETVKKTWGKEMNEPETLPEFRLTLDLPEEDLIVPESSTWAARGTPEENPLKMCVSCDDQFQSFDVIGVPCGHDYCRACLQKLYNFASSDQSLYPVRCCRQPIITIDVSSFLSPLIIQQYERKKIEYDDIDPTYCSKRTCLAYIPRFNIDRANDRTTCPDCDTQTCIKCKATAHDQDDCPNDSGLQAVLKMATKNAWKQCFSCKRMIELIIGCYHITSV